MDREKNLREIIEGVLSNSEANREASLLVARNNFEDLDERFAIGGFGHHEATDRSMLIAELVDERLLEHPTIAMIPDAFRLAALASEILHELYQVVACAGVDPGDSKTE